jgi:hypothetical protein
MTATPPGRKDPGTIPIELEAFHVKLPESWSAEREAHRFMDLMRLNHPEAIEAWIEMHAHELITSYLRDLEERKRREARRIRGVEIARIRAAERTREQAKKAAEAAGIPFDEALYPPIEGITSIFQLVSNQTSNGEMKRIGSWTRDDIVYITDHYYKVGQGYIRQGRTIETLGNLFDSRRNALVAEATLRGDLMTAARLRDPDITLSEVLTEDEVLKIWTADPAGTTSP